MSSKPIQKIIFGSPGTGKSYMIDHEIIPYELNIDIKKNPENIIKAVFHPEYTHGNFMGKLLPMTQDGQVEYNFYEGHFLSALSQAYKNILATYDRQENKIEGKEIENVVLVIDEINRGNSSAIFGSIFQLLDRDEDGWSSYTTSINGVMFIKLLELLDGGDFSKKKGDITHLSIPPFNNSSIEKLQGKLEFLNFDLINKTIKIPPNLSIVATMNTSDSSIYYMDSAFKRRWDWEFIDIDSNPVKSIGTAFNTRADWNKFIGKLNSFIKNNHSYIRGIEDKQVGKYFIKDEVVSKSVVQSKLMFFIWDSVFTRDKKPLLELLDIKDKNELITFGDFATKIDKFIEKVESYNV